MKVISVQRYLDQTTFEQGLKVELEIPFEALQDAVAQAPLEEVELIIGRELLKQIREFKREC